MFIPALRGSTIIGTSPNRTNIKLLAVEAKDLDKFTKQLSDKLKASRKGYPKTVIFGCNYTTSCKTMRRKSSLAFMLITGSKGATLLSKIFK